jgi:hypothetical protein
MGLFHLYITCKSFTNKFCSCASSELEPITVCILVALLDSSVISPM